MVFRRSKGHVFISLVGLGGLLYGMWWLMIFNPPSALVWRRKLNGPTLSPKLTTATSRPTTMNPATTTPNASDTFLDMRDFVSSIPRRPEAKLFAKIANILSEPWRHDSLRSRTFKLMIEGVTNMSTSDEIMLTQENTPLGSLIETVLHATTVNTTMDIFKMLPKKSLIHPQLYESCSVVGSGGILNGSQCGRRIDSADFVFRFNLAPTIGFEHDVGNKTSFTTMNPTITRNMYGNLKTTKDVETFKGTIKDQKGLIWTPTFAFKGYSKDSLKAIKKTNGSNPNVTFIMEGTKHFKAVHKFWKQYGVNRMFSTGFYIVNSALAMCNNVNVYGFWPFQRTLNGRLSPYHYYNEVTGRSHDFSLELRWILTMHHFGLLQFHHGNCTDDG